MRISMEAAAAKIAGFESWAAFEVARITRESEGDLPEPPDANAIDLSG
jgi:hypothetical protein